MREAEAENNQSKSEPYNHIKLPTIAEEPKQRKKSNLRFSRIESGFVEDSLRSLKKKN